MDSILELLNLLGGVFLLSAVVGAFVSVLAGDKDISAHMLPEDVEYHAFSGWELSDIAGVSVLLDGTLHLDGVGHSGERLDLRIVRAPGAFISSACAPGWEFPQTSGVAIQDSSGERFRGSTDKVLAALRSRLSFEGIRDDADEKLSMVVGVSLDPEERIEAEFSLRESPGKSLWRGKIAPRNKEYDITTELQVENKVQALVRLLTSRRPD